MKTLITFKSLWLKSTWFWLVLISLLPLFPLFHEGIPLTHDGRIHIARIANFYASLMEGNIIPRWASNLNWGYGSPILEFVYPLSSYVASLFHWMGASLPQSVTLVFGFSYIGSILAMYLWVKEQWGEKAGIISAFLYGFAPYRFVDLYVRGALGEHVAFIFPPLICYFIVKLRHVMTKHQSTLNSKAILLPPKEVFIWILGLSVSIGGLILSHNALSLLFIPVMVLYGLWIIFMEKEYRLLYSLYLLLSFSLGFLLTAFFWLPAIFEAKYTLQDKITAGAISGNFVPLSWFFYSSWNYGGGIEFSKTLGVSHWIAIFAFLLSIPKMKKYLRSVALLSLFLFVISLFMMTKQSNSIWSIVSFLQKFQFPWRFLSLSIFLSSLFGGIAYSVCTYKQYKQHSWRNIWVGVIVLGIVLSTVGMWKPKAYLTEPETNYTGIFDGTTDSGELSPVWSVRFMEYRPKEAIEIISGNANIVEGIRNTTTREYTVKSDSEVQLVENTLYYPGWNVLVDNKIVPIEFQSSVHRGLMTFYVSKGIHTVTILFSDTKVRRMANWISALSVILIVGVGMGGILWQKRR